MSKARKKTNLSVFVPHTGCPNQCSFCDQRVISGEEKPITPDALRQLLDKQAHYLREKEMTAEIAFFGGTFTAIPQDYLHALLSVAAEYRKRYPDVFIGIRCSTRPDAVPHDVLRDLRHYGVTAIELGAQSMADSVLAANQRGHTAADVENASRRIREYGFSLGLQMMTGLYQDTLALCRQTANAFVALCPDAVRIYPTVVMKGTRLGEWFAQGLYQTFSFADTVSLCAELYGLFIRNGIAVLRIGLHSSPAIEQNRLSGAYHPALGEICISRYVYLDLLTQMHALGGDTFVIYTDKRYISQIVGHKNENRQRFQSLGIRYTLRIQENWQPTVTR